jgi:ATP-dependent Clp protease adaptor protein ClpS
VMTSRGHTWNRWYGGPTIPTNALAAERDSIGCVTAVRASTAPVEVDEPTREVDVTPDQPWIVIVWNDPINLMTYVVYVFQKLFGYSREKATALMLDVHHKGRAVVSNGSREKAELDVFRLHEHGLWATLQQDK